MKVGTSDSTDMASSCPYDESPVASTNRRSATGTVSLLG